MELGDVETRERQGLSKTIPADPSTYCVWETEQRSVSSGSSVGRLKVV